MTYEKKVELVPLWERSTLNLEEATAYTGIGRHTLCELAEAPNCNFILWVGKKRLFKRKQLDEFIEKAYSI